VDVDGKEIDIRGKLVRIARLADDTYDFLEDPEAAVEALRKSNFRIDLFTFIQRLPHTWPQYKYPMEMDNLAVLPVSTFDQWWTGQVDNKTRNMVRKAEKKGVELREVPFDEAMIKAISEIYNECPIRQGKPFVHYRKDFQAVRKQAGTFLDRSVFIGAFLAGRMIGFAKLIWDQTRTQAGLVHLLSLVEHRDKAPTNALVAQSVRACAGRSIPYLVYSRFSDGNKQRDSLMDFKENNGFKRVDLPRYYVPFTLFGSAAFHLGLHKRFADHIPEPVLNKARELRNVWRTRRLQSASGGC
jgi:hypothetical protein